MATTQRETKGSPLTWDEMDANFQMIDDHLADTVDAHDASAISIADAGGYFTATDVEGALQEHMADTAGAHAASAISNTPAGGIAATTVQAAIDELDTEKAPKASPTFTGPVTVSGGQIAFPATQAASADANTLDDYEEGTYTPTVTSGSGSITAYSAYGSYTKVGRKVSVNITIEMTNAGTAGGALIVTLPFTNQATYRVAGAGVEVAATSYALFAHIAGGGSTIACNKYDGTALITTGHVYVLSATFFV